MSCNKTIDNTYKYFIVEKDNLGDIKNEWARKYFTDPNLHKEFFKSKCDTNLNLITENIYNQNDEFVLKIEKVKKRVSLMRMIELEKITTSNNTITFSLDSLPSKYLIFKNKAKYDSLLYVMPEGHYMCGTSRLQLFRSEIPTNEILSFDEGNKLYEELAKVNLKQF